MNKRSTFQLAAVVGIVAIACVLYVVVPRPEYPAITLETPQVWQSSAFFQAHLLADWTPPNGSGGQRRKQSVQSRREAERDAEAFLAVSAWAAQPHSPLPLVPCTELAVRGASQKSTLGDELALLALMILQPATWDVLGSTAAVGTGAGPAGPLSVAASLLAEPELRDHVAEEGAGHGVVVWGSRTTNVALGNGTSRKSYRDRFTGQPEETDRALRAFRERLEEKARQLGAEVRNPAETVRENLLVGFAFEYALAPRHGRVEVSLGSGLARDHELRVEIEESQD